METPQSNETQEPYEEDEDTFQFSSRLNFILACSAILISVASFYATYLQAKSAEQQVKAMTFPLIQYGTSNYSGELQASVISLNLYNSGVGPAIVKNVKFTYQGKSYFNVMDFVRDCCSTEYAEFKSLQKQNELGLNAQFLTSGTNNTIIPTGGQIQILSFQRHEKNDALWKVLNDARFEVKAEICYCSLLEQCYTSNGKGETQEIEQCPVVPNQF